MGPRNTAAYAADAGDSTPEYASTDPRYAAPSLEAGSPYTDEPGWAPPLRLSPASIPDTTRLGVEPRRDFRPDPVRPPDEFWDRTDRDTARRHSVEQIDANGWEETKRGTGHPNPDSGAHRFAPNPRSRPPAESRVTQLLAPRTHSFWRPFMTGLPKMGARSLNGEHFSMADHRRNYEIYGMAPVRTARNTYRTEPTPWDANIVDMPPDVGPSRVEPVPTVEVAYQSRSWRL